ncbi:hypothetical protein Prudu_000572 [Prunus dulcis]|uniref:Uncharacterized protein n=1 Tax=Prunus dulcis TaxID=3755 RepID=A0A4Y1QLK3_PRUDU|nr:hypothetical protein Prudu_000572 [Prunus dulcis]
MLEFSGEFYRFGHPRAAGAVWVEGYCGSGALGPRAIPYFHERVDDDCTEFGSPAQSASAATAPALLDHVVVGPGASQAPASSASSVAQPASARRRGTPRHHRHDIDRRYWCLGITASEEEHPRCRQLKTAKVTRVTNSRISIGYDDAIGCTYGGVA